VKEMLEHHCPVFRWLIAGRTFILQAPTIPPRLLPGHERSYLQPGMVRKKDLRM
jgi:hypothetical protein